jgi:maltose alpha-D-glucosyltransferase/alpha-amylase
MAMTDSTVLNDRLHWYKDAIIYELHIKAFKDGNDDGIGDFTGLLEKLDYLEELGVTAIWLLPFYPSPQKDDGYDIADYYHINPSYGDLKEFKKILKEAHLRNIKIITELVINHTSDQHPWFQRARNAPKGSSERNFYVWTDDPAQYQDVRIIFRDFENSNWTWDAQAQQYYWHRFFHHQPDLNYDNPGVQEEVFKIIDYWCKMGVDGFRLDAVPYLFEREGTNGENLPETHEFLKKLRAHVDEFYPGTLLLAEANMWPEDSASYFGNGDECHMNYHFPVMPRMFMALQMEDRYPITDIFDQTPTIPPTCQWAMFLRNHDELTLEMVTDEERDYMYRAYAKDSKARINLGIRHRLAPLLDNDRRKIELMNSLLFSMPGTPVLYYGDEIGMGDNFYLGDRDGVRTPMQWSPDRNAGFSNANPQQLYLPVVLDPEYNYEAVNVETQRRNTSSLFWFMKHLISIRKKYKAFGRGDMKFINVDNPKVLAFTRTYEDEILLIIVNLSKFFQPAEIDLTGYSGFTPVEIFSKNVFPVIRENSPYFFTLGAHSFQWFVLEKAERQAVKKEKLPVLQIKNWGELLQEQMKQILEDDILPVYLENTNWFTAKRLAIYKIEIIESTNIDLKEELPVPLLLLEITYKSGLPENYSLPLTFVKEGSAHHILYEFPQSIVAKLKVNGEEGILCDAFFTPALQSWLFENLAENETYTSKGSTIVFRGTSELKNYFRQHKTIRPRIFTSRYLNNTAITYDNQFFLKLYRKIDTEINPDREVSEYLSQAKFSYTPACFGSIEWKLKNGTYTLGLMQEMVENHGDGYSYMQERVNNYIERILAAEKGILHRLEKRGSFADPVGYDELPQELQVLLGGRASDQSWLLGVRTGQLHLALSESKTFKDFIPENFSLHYQRSLYSSMLVQVREAYQAMQQKKAILDEIRKQEIEKLLHRKNEILNLFKKIYSKKLDVVKIRIHGSLSLAQVLLTGRDVAFQDFGGIPSRNYSDRRLKRSPLRDVASMLRSYYYAAYEGVFSSGHVSGNDAYQLFPYAEIWTHYMGSFFMKAYLEIVRKSDFIPKADEDMKMMLQIYLLENALNALTYELGNRPDKIWPSLNMINDILK